MLVFYLKIRQIGWDEYEKKSKKIFTNINLPFCQNGIPFCVIFDCFNNLSS